MSQFRNLLGLPVKGFADRKDGQVLVPMGDHWEFADQSGDGISYQAGVGIDITDGVISATGSMLATFYAGDGITLLSDIGLVRAYIAGDIKDGGTPAVISFDQGIPATRQIVVSGGASPIQFALAAGLDGLSIDHQSGVLSYDGVGGSGSGRIVVTATDANALQCAITPVITIYGASTSRVVQVAHTFATSGNACPAFASTPSPGNTVYAWYFAEAGPAANTAAGWDYVGNHQGGREGGGLLKRTVQQGDGLTLPPPVTSSLSFHTLLLAEVAHGGIVHDNLNQFSQGTTVSWGPVTTVDNGLVLIGAGRLNSQSTPTFTGATALYVGSNYSSFGSAALGWIPSDGMDKNGTVSLGSSNDGSGCIAVSVGS